MATVNFRVMQGADRGRSYLDLKLPITIGREEGNAIQLNDERISRFHIKIQEDNRHIVLTDLDSTNGTRVNGVDSQLRILRFGDVITVGRSILLFGTRDEISARLDDERTSEPTASGAAKDADFDMFGSPDSANLLCNRAPEPKIPERLSPSQAAQLSELLEFFHGQFGTIVETVKIPELASNVIISKETWQLMLQVYSRMGELIRSVADPEG
ncbi:MAG: FHA domain-containing protein [Pirellulaceae bacterium]|nr:FHA domain-containing protein [Pirellulaceae bacterium]